MLNPSEGEAMPDGSAWVPAWTPLTWSGAALAPPPPAPPQLLGPFPQRPITIVDAWGVYLADPSGALIGFDTNFGRGGPLARVLDAGRSETRNL